MKTVFYTATTLDGFIADEHDSLDWLLTQPQDDEPGPFDYDAFYRGVGALTMGATTYEWVADHLRTTGESWSYAEPSWVFTHRDLTPIADNVTFTAAPVPQVHAAMAEAAGGKDLWVVGGGDLAAQFAGHGLLDEIVVSIAPVTLGSGRPLYTRAYDLELLEHGRNGAFLCARYRVLKPR